MKKVLFVVTGLVLGLALAIAIHRFLGGVGLSAASGLYLLVWGVWLKGRSRDPSRDPERSIDF